VAPFRGGAVSPDSIARALRVGTIVTGTVEPTGDSIHLTVEMVNPASGELVGSMTEASPRRDALSLRDAMARDFSLLLRQRLGPTVRQLGRGAETRNPAAWELMERGRAARRLLDTLLLAGDTAAAGRTLDLADSLLAAAADLDRNWAGPVVERGWVATDRRRLVMLEPRAVAAWSTRALPLATEALRRKPDDPAALHLRGMVRYFQWLVNLPGPTFTADQLLAAAESDLRAGAAEGNPNRASSLSLLSHLLARKSQTAEAMVAARQAYEADPYLTEADVVIWRLFSAELDLGHAEEARRWCAEGVRRFPTDPFFTDCRIEEQALPGARPDPDRLWQLAEDGMALWPPTERVFRRRRADLLVAMGLARAGLRDSAQAVARRVLADTVVNAGGGELLYIAVLLENVIGDRDEALRLLERWLALNPQDRPTVAADQTWWFDGLRDDPRFRALTAEPPSQPRPPR
jgi:eukaryotic-like serine/threonine-protein kinase